MSSLYDQLYEMLANRKCPVNKCLPKITNVNVGTANKKHYYTFNGDLINGSTFKMSPGKYVLRGIPKSHPMAILNLGSTKKIAYSGNNATKVVRKVTNSTANGEYVFYWGDISINVMGDFNTISVYSANNRPLGGEYVLRYDAECNDNSTSNNNTPVAPIARASAPAAPIARASTTYAPPIARASAPAPTPSVSTPATSRYIGKRVIKPLLQSGSKNIVTNTSTDNVSTLNTINRVSLPYFNL